MTKENYSSTSEENQLGLVELAPEVIEVISHIAANEVEGVDALKGDFTTDIKSFFGKSSYNNGVELTTDSEGLSVDVYCNFKYGVNVPKVALEVQERVREQILHMTEIDLAEVNIHVVSLVPDKSVQEPRFNFQPVEDVK